MDSRQQHNLGIIISTMRGRLWDNKALVANVRNLDLPTVVVNQDPARFHVESREEDGCLLVINTPQTGLSSSRNLLLQNATFQFAILCDDDVELIEDEVLGFAKFLNQLDHPDNLFFHSILLGIGKNPWRAKYPKHASSIDASDAMFWRKIQRVNSMELVLNVEWLRRNDIQFDTNFGLGSRSTNGGEEVLLLHKALTTGAKLYFYNHPLRFHEGESSGQVLDALGAYTRGLVHRKTAMWIWWPALVLRFVWRSRVAANPLKLIRRYMTGLLNTAT